jgi:hypothetical protein
MNSKVLFISAFMSVFVCASAPALAPMGTPTANLKTGQFYAGFDFSTSQEDIEADYGNDYVEIWKDVQSNLFAANIGYGICDNWEIFTRLGVADAGFDKYENDGETISQNTDGDYGFLFGLGTKVTWAKQENIDWGALFQIHWLNSELSNTMTDDVGTVFESNWDVHMYEIQVAVGPTWMVNEDLSIYGGPFFHFIGGDADYDSSIDGVPYSSRSVDLKEKSSFGGYVGAQYQLGANTSVYAEFQFTGDAWALGAGIGWKI